MREVSAGAILFYNDKQKGRQYLLLQGGKGRAWLFPKGKMDKGETEETAALREILEETGVKDITFIGGHRLGKLFTEIRRRAKLVVRLRRRQQAVPRRRKWRLVLRQPAAREHVEKTNQIFSVG